MKKLFPILVLVGIAVLVLGSCVWPGTGTIRLRHDLSGARTITAVYIYPTGSPDTDNWISSTMVHGDVQSILGVPPGPTTVVAVINSGAETASETLTVTDGTIHVVWIVDSDID